MRIVTVKERERRRSTGWRGAEEKGRGNRVNYEAKQISLVTTVSEGAQDACVYTGGGVYSKGRTKFVSTLY